MRWRYRLAQWLVPELDERVLIEVPYQAAVIILPLDKSWTGADIDALNAAMEVETGKPVAAVMFTRSILVDITRSLP